MISFIIKWWRRISYRFKHRGDFYVPIKDEWIRERKQNE